MSLVVFALLPASSAAVVVLFYFVLLRFLLPLHNPFFRLTLFAYLGWQILRYSRSRVSLNGILQKNPIRVVRVIKTGKASAHVHLVWLFFCLCVVFVFLFYFPFRYHFRLVNFESTNELLLLLFMPSLPHCQALGWAFTILYIGHMGHLMHMSATIMKSNLGKATAPASP